LSTTALRINHKDEQFAKKALSLHEKFQILEIITFWPYMAYLENCKKQSIKGLFKVKDWTVYWYLPYKGTVQKPGLDQ
jgi:hypothetical protein